MGEIHHAKANGFGEYCLQGCKQQSAILGFAGRVGDRDKKVKERKASARKGKLLLSAEKEEMTECKAPGAT